MKLPISKKYEGSKAKLANANEPGVRSKTLRHLLAGSLFGFGLLALFIQETDLSLEQLAEFTLDWTYLTGYLLTIIVFTAIRAIRLHLMLSLDAPHRVLGTLFTQATVRDLLPGWVGEPVLIWLLKRWNGIEMGAATSALFVYRFIELSIYTICFLVAGSFFVAVLPHSLSIAGIVVCLVVLFVPLGLHYSSALNGLVRQRINGHQETASAEDSSRASLPGVSRYFDALRAFANQFLRTAVSIVKPRTYYNATFLSLLSIAVLVAGFFFVIKALDQTVSFALCAVVFALQLPISVLPIRAVANIGTHEVGWLYALILLGYSEADAGVLAVHTHLIFLIGTLFKFACAVVALLLIRQFSSKPVRE